MPLAIAGAVAADGIDSAISAHYGDPLREQRILAERVGFVDRSNRGVLQVSGQDRLSWLHSLTTQHLEQLPADHATETVVLSPHGHIEHHILITETGEMTWLDVEPDTAPALLHFLQSMRFMLRVEPVDVSPEWALLTLVGPQTENAVTAIDGELGPQPYDVRPLISRRGWVRRMPWPGTMNADVMVHRDELADVTKQLLAADVPAAGIAAFEALRVAARRPRLHAETDHRTIVQEPDWISTAVHLDKGCYRGQETVAKVENLGHPPRRMVLLHLDGSDDELPAHGTEVSYGDRTIGLIGTAAHHYELGPIALALIKRNTPTDAILRVGTMQAAQDHSAS